MKMTKTNIDFYEAKKWYQIASQNSQDDGAALFEYALLHKGNRMVAQDLDALFKLMHQSAKRRYAPAQYYLGNAYFYGELIDMDEKQGVYWLKRAVEQRHIPAYQLLGVSYFHGWGVKKDYNKALENLRIAHNYGFDSFYYLNKLRKRL